MFRAAWYPRDPAHGCADLPGTAPSLHTGCANLPGTPPSLHTGCAKPPPIPPLWDTTLKIPPPVGSAFARPGLTGPPEGVFALPMISSPFPRDAASEGVCPFAKRQAFRAVVHGRPRPFQSAAPSLLQSRSGCAARFNAIIKKLGPPPYLTISPSLS